MAKKKILAGKMGNSKYFFDENGNIVDQTGAVAPRAIAAAILAGIESIPEVEVEDKAPATPKAPKKVKQAKSKEQTEEESSLSRVTQKISRGSGNGAIGGTLGNIARTIGAGTIAASVGSVPNLRGVAAATLDAAGVGGLVTLGGGGGGGGRRPVAATSGGAKNPEKESVGILEGILNVLKDNNELLQDLLSSLTAAARGRIEDAREANKKGGEAGKGVTGTDAKELEEPTFLGKWGKIIAAALGTVYGIIQGWLKALKFFAEAFLPEGLIKYIKGKFAAFVKFFEEIILSVRTILSNIRTAFRTFAIFLEEIFTTFKGIFSASFQKIGAAFEEAFSKITNLFKSVGSESKLGKILASFGSAINKLSGPFIQAFEVIKTLTLGPATTLVNIFKLIGGLIAKFVGIVNEVASVAINTIKYLGEFAGVFKFVSGIVSKLVLPLFVIMTVWDTVKGAIEGFEKDGIVGGIKGAVLGFFNSLIFGPLDMLKDAAAWVLKQFGFENAAKVLESFSFVTIFSDIIGTMVGSIIDSFKSMFNDLGVMVDQLMSGDILGGIGTAIKIISRRFFMIPDMIIQGVGSVITKILNFFGFTEVADKITEFLKGFNLTDGIINGLTAVFKIVTDFFASIPGIISKFVTDQIKKLPYGEELLKALKPEAAGFATGASGSFGGGAAQRNLEERTASIAPDTQKVESRPDGMFVGENYKKEWDAKYKGKYDPTTGEKLVQPISAESPAPISDLTPTENTTAPAFLKKVTEEAVKSSAPAAPIIIDNSTKNNVNNSRPSSISPRVSSGAPSTAPVMSHIDRSLYPFIGAYP